MMVVRIPSPTGQVWVIIQCSAARPGPSSPAFGISLSAGWARWLAAQDSNGQENWTVTVTVFK